jgi:cell division protein FtsN
MKNFFGKNFVIFLSLMLASCASKNDQQSKIRIVDLQGKSHPVITRVPELNAQALVAQGKIVGDPFANKNTAPTQKDLTQNTPDYGAIQPESLQKTPRPIVAENAVAANKDQAVEYDLSDPAETKKLSEKAPAKKAVISKSKKPAKAAAVAKSGRFSVQVGSFSNQESANQTLVVMQKFHAGKVETVEGEKTIYRVLLGPFSARKQANELVKKITDSGHEAILVRNK